MAQRISCELVRSISASPTMRAATVEGVAARRVGASTGPAAQGNAATAQVGDFILIAVSRRVPRSDVDGPRRPLTKGCNRRGRITV